MYVMITMMTMMISMMMTNIVTMMITMMTTNIVTMMITMMTTLTQVSTPVARCGCSHFLRLSAATFQVHPDSITSFICCDSRKMLPR